MAYIIDECNICGAGGRCEDCHGDDEPGLTCLTCGGSGEESPMLPSCPSEGCAASFARNNP